MFVNSKQAKMAHKQGKGKKKQKKNQEKEKQKFDGRKWSLRISVQGEEEMCAASAEFVCTKWGRCNQHSSLNEAPGGFTYAEEDADFKSSAENPSALPLQPKCGTNVVCRW